jgi:hypothetical protein
MRFTRRAHSSRRYFLSVFCGAIRLSNVVNLTKGDREGRPYKRLSVRHIRRGDLHGRPYVGKVLNVKLTTLDLKPSVIFFISNFTKQWI